MSTIEERIKEVRKNENLTQEEFGERLGGIARNTITAYETGGRAPSKQAIQLICSTFKVRREWLETGEGPMYKKDLLDELQEQYALTPFEIEIIRGYLRMDPKARKSLMDFFANLVDVVTKDPEYIPESERRPDERKTLKETLHDDLDKEIALQKKHTEKSTGSDSIAG